MPVNSFENYPMSWKPDKSKLTRPFYQSLANALEYDIKNGFLAPGTKLPPQRELADFLDINFTTVTRSYKICTVKGLIYTKSGSGTFVSPNATRSITISASNITEGCIDLGFVASFEECNSIVAEAAKQTVKKKYLKELFNYDEPSGFPHQKTAALNWLKYLGVNSDADHLAIVSGAQNALAVSLMALFEPGNKIAVDFYTFSNFIELSKMLHIKLIPIKGDENGMIAEELENECSLNSIQGIYLMPSCSNPTTIQIPIKRRNELAKVIKKYNLTLIEDDSYGFLMPYGADCYKNSMFELVPENTVYICGTSKALCSGLRIAYMVFGDKFKEKILKTIFNVNVKTSSLNAEIVTELILSGMAKEIIFKKITLAKEANKIYDKYFCKKSKPEKQFSFYRWLPINSNKKSSILEKELLDRGVEVFHSERFICGSPEKDKQYLRVALSSAKSIENLERGLAILKSYLDSVNLICIISILWSIIKM